MVLDHSDYSYSYQKNLKNNFMSVSAQNGFCCMSRGVRQKVRSYKIFLTHFLREASKKSAVLNGRAIKREGGGGKGPAIKEKELFLELFFLILLK